MLGDEMSVHRKKEYINFGKKLFDFKHYTEGSGKHKVEKI